MHEPFQYKVWASPVLLSDDPVTDPHVVSQTAIPAFESEEFINHIYDFGNILQLDQVDDHMPLQTQLPADLESEEFIEYPSNVDGILGMESVDTHMPLQTQLPADLESPEFVNYTQTPDSITFTGAVPIVDANVFNQLPNEVYDEEPPFFYPTTSDEPLLSEGAAVAPFDPEFFDNQQPFQEFPEDELDNLNNLMINNHLDLGTGLLVVSAYDYNRRHMVDLTIDKDTLLIVGYSTTNKPVWKETLK